MVDMNDRTHCETCKHYCPSDERNPCYAGRTCTYTPIDGLVVEEPEPIKADPIPPKMTPVDPSASKQRCQYVYKNKKRCKKVAVPGSMYCLKHKE